ncbi:unnamed protein product [Eruca vesicaria subsp. sativa]|uniref:Uncharacterized protein n=1 Tax=Eruca vesicaria subsp. sativa TaxID=29727 RepID=A0ABC8KNF2_ERUVS|nr:unnamed protein product [Eruca vesicaria subsp. sativa]
MRADIFDRVQLPHDRYGRQPLLSDTSNTMGTDKGMSKEIHSRMSDPRTNDHGTRLTEWDSYYPHSSGDDSHKYYHADRVMRGRDARVGNMRYKGSRHGKGLYDCNFNMTLSEKERKNESKYQNFSEKATDLVPYEHVECNGNTTQDVGKSQRSSETNNAADERQCKHQASTIVAPGFQQANMHDNVTIRSKTVARSLTFSLQTSFAVVMDEQVIGALSDMEVHAKDGDGDDMMASDDLFDYELKDLEDKARHPDTMGSLRAKHSFKCG